MLLLSTCVSKSAGDDRGMINELCLKMQSTKNGVTSSSCSKYCNDAPGRGLESRTGVSEINTFPQYVSAVEVSAGGCSSYAVSQQWKTLGDVENGTLHAAHALTLHAVKARLYWF